MDLGPQREKIAGDWRRFHSEELHDIHLSSNLFRVIKSRSITWEEHTVPMKRGKYKKGFGEEA
jgi:hypothetical protein